MLLTVSEIKKLLKNYYTYKASISGASAESHLKRKLDALDRAVAALDEESKQIVDLVFYKRQSVENVALILNYSRSTLYYRVNIILDELSYMVG